MVDKVALKNIARQRGECTGHAILASAGRTAGAAVSSAICKGDEKNARSDIEQLAGFGIADPHQFFRDGC